MGVGYDLNQLNYIACAAIGINQKAGGAAAFAQTGDYMPDFITWACNMRAANIGLGGSGDAAGDFTSIPNLLIYIACQSKAMADSTGSGLDIPWGDPYNALDILNYIACQLIQVTTNQGSTFEGGITSNVWNAMNTIACVMAKIVDNGFGPPPPPSPDFWYDAALLASGAVTTWPDVSGHSRDLSVTAGSAAVSSTQNGHNALTVTTGALTATNLGTPTARTVLVALSRFGAVATTAAVNFGNAAGSGRFAFNRIAVSGWQLNHEGVNTAFGSGNIQTPGVLAFKCDNAGNVSIYYDGVLVTTFTQVDTTVPFSNTITVGAATSTGTGNATMNAFEIKGWNSLLSDADIATESAALKAKWALP